MNNSFIRFLFCFFHWSFFLPILFRFSRCKNIIFKSIWERENRWAFYTWCSSQNSYKQTRNNFWSVSTSSLPNIVRYLFVQSFFKFLYPSSIPHPLKSIAINSKTLSYIIKRINWCLPLSASLPISSIFLI